MVSSRQREDVEKRLEYTVVHNSQQPTPDGQRHVINVRAAIQLAFALGIRAGMSHPDVIGDYMGRWITDRTLQTTPKQVAERHEQALHGIMFPLQWTPDEWDELEGD